MINVQHKNTPINIRMSPSQKALIDKAAALINNTRSDFVLESACKEAEHVLLDRRLFLVDDQTYQAFTAALESPVEDNVGLKALLNSKSLWENQ